MKFLNIDGLSHFLDKTKTWVDDNYYGKKSGVSINDSSILIDDTDNVILSHISNTDISIRKASTKQVATVSVDNITVMKGATQSRINSDSIESPKFVKDDGTNQQVLLANGDVITLDEANGIPTLNADGKIDADKVAIDTTLFEVVTELPNTKETIIKNRIYLKASTETDPSGKNIYSEYIYTGDMSTEYDETKWEKLGEYKSDVDLSGYAKKTEAISSFSLNPNAEWMEVEAYAQSEYLTRFRLPLATSTMSGLISPLQVSKLDNIADSATADEALSNDDIDTLFA